MLAYVFWHWKQAGIAREAYETRQRAFHAALASEPAAGFIDSFSVALAQAAWTKSDGEVYEDWYLVQDFTALGTLNEAAISASRSAPHDAAAMVAAGGTSGLYKLQTGTVLRHPHHAYWFGKPAGLSYGDLSVQLRPIIEQSQSGLWMRQMVLGPAAEFCLHTAAPVSLPAGLEVQPVPLRSIWPPTD